MKLETLMRWVKEILITLCELLFRYSSIFKMEETHTTHLKKYGYLLVYYTCRRFCFRAYLEIRTPDTIPAMEQPNPSQPAVVWSTSNFDNITSMIDNHPDITANWIPNNIAINQNDQFCSKRLRLAWKLWRFFDDDRLGGNFGLLGK